MPQIRMPDGQVVAFPDDMPRDQINAMIRNRYPETDTGRIDRKTAIAERIYKGMQEGENDAPMTGQERWGDYVHAVGTGLNTGVGALIGLPGTAQDLVEAGANRLGRAVTGESRIQQEARLTNTPGYKKGGMGLIPDLPNISEVLGGMESIAPGSTSYQPKQRGARFAQTVASFAPGAAGGFTRGVLAPGLMSEGAGQLTEGTALELPARIAGAVMSPLALKTAGRVVSPFAASAKDTKAARLLESQGIPLTAGQRTKSKALRFAEEEIGGRSMENFAKRQSDAFTNRMLRSVDPNTKHMRAGADEMTEMGEALSDTFTQLGKRNIVAPDRDMAVALRAAWDDYALNTSKATRTGTVKAFLQDIMSYGSAPMPASRYQSLRSKLEKMRRESTDPQVKIAFGKIRSALDDAMERSIARFNPADSGAYSQARNSYRNYLAIEDAVTRAGSEAAAGVLTPQAMAGALKKSRGKRSWARSNTELEEIVRAGNELMYPLNNSNTAGRMAARGFIHSPAMIGGAVTGYQEAGGGFEGLLGGLAGAAAGRLANRALGRTILSRPVRRYLSNQIGAPLANGPGILGTLRRTAGAP